MHQKICYQEATQPVSAAGAAAAAGGEPAADGQRAPSAEPTPRLRAAGSRYRSRNTDVTARCVRQHEPAPRNLPHRLLATAIGRRRREMRVEGGNSVEIFVFLRAPEGVGDLCEGGLVGATGITGEDAHHRRGLFAVVKRSAG